MSAVQLELFPAQNSLLRECPMLETVKMECPICGFVHAVTHLLCPHCGGGGLSHMLNSKLTAHLRDVPEKKSLEQDEDFIRPHGASREYLTKKGAEKIAKILRKKDREESEE